SQTSLIAVYSLLVCPKFDPHTFYFSQGESAVLKCNTDIFRAEYKYILWFRRTAERHYRPLFDTRHRVVPLDLEGKLNTSKLPSSLIIFNLSQMDSGEYLCAVMSGIRLCASGTKFLLTFVDSDMYGIGSTFYTVRSAVLSSGLLGMICALIAVNVSICRRNQEHNQGDNK
uniref:Ig-like domain-containing protein n=1 Tax=Myripristis murdjan TaxID=586833 RepID=A0A667ZUU1_9TELE